MSTPSSLGVFQLNPTKVLKSKSQTSPHKAHRCFRLNALKWRWGRGRPSPWWGALVSKQRVVFYLIPSYEARVLYLHSSYGKPFQGNTQEVIPQVILLLFSPCAQKLDKTAQRDGSGGASVLHLHFQNSICPNTWGAKGPTRYPGSGDAVAPFLCKRPLQSSLSADARVLCTNDKSAYCCWWLHLGHWAQPRMKR